MNYIHFRNSPGRIFKDVDVISVDIDHVVEFVQEKTEEAVENGTIKDPYKEHVRTTFDDFRQWAINRWGSQKIQDKDEALEESEDEDSDIEIVKDELELHWRSMKAAGTLDLPLAIRFYTCWVKQKNAQWNRHQVCHYYCNHWKDIYEYYWYVIIIKS